MSANLLGIGSTTNYAKNEQDFVFRVFINKGELNQIHKWVREHNNIETGGDLFGLWIDEHTAVVQFVLGPGKGCHRTSTSFFQDVSYLKNAGSYLTKAHGLCNIGQWHSHHRIGLFKPSGGDDNTVWSNMPGLGLDRYIVFIANITNTVEVNCFLYQIKNGRELPVTLGKFHELDANSPFRLNENLLQHIYNGAESFNQIPVFEKEKLKIVNDDAKKGLNISVQNESRTGNYTRNIVQKTSVVSGWRQETANSHNPNPLTDKSHKTKGLEKLSTSGTTAIIYRTPEPERQRIKKQTKQLDTPQNIQSQETIIVKNKEKMTKNDQNTSGITDGLQKAVNSHNKIVLEDKTKKRDKNQNKLVTATVYHVPAPLKLTVKSLQDDRSPSRTQTNLHDTQRNIQSQIENKGRMETTVSGRQTYNSTASQSTWKPNDRANIRTPNIQNRNMKNDPTTSKEPQSLQSVKSTVTATQSGLSVKTTSPDDQIPMKATITNNQDQQFTSHTNLAQARKQQEHTKRTPPTTLRGSENYYTLTTPQIKQKGWQIDNEKYDAISSSCRHNLQKQNTTVSYINSKAVVPDQQEPNSTIIKPRITSGECDNVTATFETPQFKAYRSNTEVSEDLATVAERLSTPSGTFSSHESHDEGKESEENCDDEKRNRSLTDFMCTWICGMFKELSISEPDSKETKRKKKRDDGSVPKKNNRKRLKGNSSV